MPWSIELIERYKGNFIDETLLKYVVLPWSISQNIALPWSTELIERYIDKWDWHELSINPALPWSIEFIEKYIDKWHWYKISSNRGLPWSIAFIERYLGELDWFELSGSITLPWSKELIIKFKDKWELTAIYEADDWDEGPNYSNCYYCIPKYLLTQCKVELIERIISKLLVNN